MKRKKAFVWIVLYQDGSDEVMTVLRVNDVFTSAHDFSISATSLSDAVQEFRNESPDVVEVDVYEWVYSWINTDTEITIK